MEKLDVILLIGRPAAGKSETIDFLKQLPDEKRLQEYHVAPFEELDEFLYA
jgi:predicted ATPase